MKEVYVVKNFMDGNVYLFSNEPTELDISKTTGYAVDDVKTLLESEEFNVELQEVVMNG